MTKKTIKKDWMVMIYLAGDNNLSEDMAGTLNQISTMTAGSPENVAVLAYYDSGYPHVPTRYCDLTHALGTGKGLSEDDCKVVKEANSANPKSIVEFVRFCTKKYKAKNCALFLSGHTDGFQQISLFRDEQARATMSLSGLGESLKKINKLIKNKLQILAFDGCVMGSVEMAYEFREVANILVGSQGFIPNAGLNYAQLFEQWGNEHCPISAQDLAVKIIEVYLNQEKGFEIGGRSVTMSACRLNYEKQEGQEDKANDHSSSSPIVKLVEKINELSKILYDELQLTKIFKLPEDEPEEGFVNFVAKKYLKWEQLKKILLSSQWNAQTLLFDQSVDIGDFCERLKDECGKSKLSSDFIFYNLSALADQLKELPEQPAEIIANCRKIINETQNFVVDPVLDEIIRICQEIIAEVKRCVIAPEGAKTIGTEYQFCQGLSLYFPWSQIGYGMTEREYDQIAFCEFEKDRNWKTFLEFYLQRVTVRGFNENLWHFLYQILESKTENNFSVIDVNSSIEKILNYFEDEKYNPTYNERGIEDDTYLRFFRKFKNIPSYIEDANPFI